MREQRELSRGKKQKVLRITGWIISVPVILFLLLNIFGQMFFAEQLMDIVGFRTFLVRDSRSMLPQLRYRDLIVTRRFDFEDLKVGDFVSFETTVTENGVTRTITVTHAIIEAVIDEKTGEKAFRTSGINPLVSPDRRLMTIDGADNTNRYIGRYVFRLAAPGRISGFLTSIPGVVAIVVNVVCAAAIIVVIFKD